MTAPVAAPSTAVAGAQLAALAIVVACAFGLLAVALGQTDSWDLRNYHLYDGWAFWTGRGARDFAAAQAQTYFNPLLATGTYLLFVNTPPWLSAFVLGAVQGANIVPVYLIARRMLARRSAFFSAGVAFVGVAGATQISELGSSIGDNLISLPVLCAFALVLAPSAPLDARRALGAGLLVGLTTGLKLTAAPFALGLLAAVLLVADRGRPRRLLFLMAAAAAAVGFAASDGFWMWRLYREFGNPLHPMFGGFFGGPFASVFPLRDTRFIPRTAFEWLAYPLAWVQTPQLVSDVWMRDLRIPLAFALAPLLLVRSAAVDRRVERALAAGLAVAYLAWLPVFGIYRYVVALEMLAPLLVALAMQRLPRVNATIATAALLALMTLSVNPPYWGRLRAYGAHFLETDVPALPDLDRATIVLTDDAPLAFLALGFPASAQFVRIGGNLLGPPYPPYGMDTEAARRIAAGAGPVYALIADPVSERALAVLQRQHLMLAARCASIRSNLLESGSHPMLCPVQKAGAPAPAAAGRLHDGVSP